MTPTGQCTIPAPTGPGLGSPGCMVANSDITPFSGYFRVAGNTTRTVASDTFNDWVEQF